MSLSSEFAIAVKTHGLTQAQKELRALSSEARKLKKVQEELTDATGETGESLEDLGRKASQSSGRLKVVGRDINRYVTLPLLAFSGVATKFALDLNKGLGSVQTLIPRTGERIYELRDALTSLARESGRSFSDLTQGLYRTISVFQDNADTVERLNVAVRAGIAGYATTAEAVQLLASVTRAYGDTSAEAVSKVSDLAFEAIRLGDTTFPALAGAMQVATDRADRLNVSQEELFASFATLTGVTGDAAMVATQFRSAMDSLLNPTDALNELLERQGFASAEASIEARGMIGTLTMIAREAERTNRPLQDFITRKEGITFASRLAGAQLGDFNMRLNAMYNSAGAANEAFTGATTGIARFNFQLDKSKMLIQTSFAEIGQNLLPVVVALTSAVALLVESFANLPAPIQYVILGLTGLVAVMGIVIKLKGVLLSLKMVGLFKGIGASVGALNGKLKITAALLGVLKTVLLPVMAVALTGAVAYTLHQRRLRQEMERTTEAMNTQRRAMARLRDDQDDSLRNRRAVSRVEEFRMNIQDQGIPNELMSPMGSINQANASGRFTALDSLSALQNSNLITRITNELADLDQQSIQTLENLTRASAEVQRITADSSRMTNDMRESMGFSDEALRARVNELNEGIAESSARITNLHGIMVRLNADLLLPDTQGNVYTKSYAIAELPGMEQRQEAERERRRQLSHERDLASALLVRNREANRLNNTLRDEIAIRQAILGELTPDEVPEGITIPEVGEERLKTWREWFSEVTGVEIFNASGEQAARLFSSSFESSLAFAELFETTLGNTFNTSSFLSGSLGQLREQIIELMAIPASEIFDVVSDPAFSIFGEADPDTALGGVLAKYREVFQRFYVSLAEDARKGWKDQEESLSSYTNILNSLGIDTERLQNTQETFTARLRETQQALEEGIREGLLPGSDGYLALQHNINLATIALAKYKRTYEEVLGSLSAGASIESRVYDMAINLLGVRERTKTALDAESDALERGNINKEDYLANVEKILKKNNDWELGTAMLVNGLKEFGKQGLQVVAESMKDLGAAYREAGGWGEDLINVWSDMTMTLLELIPQLMIQAGLALLSAGQIPIGLALIAAGLVGQIGVGYLSSWRDEGDTEYMAKGGVLNSPTRIRPNVVAGEAGYEGVLPLARTSSGDLGVQVAGGGTVVSPQVNIYNYAGVDVEQDSDEQGNISIYLKRAVKGIIADGSVDREMRSRYGVRTYGRA